MNINALLMDERDNVVTCVAAVPKEIGRASCRERVWSRV